MNCCKEKDETFTQCLCHDDGSITCLECGKVLHDEKLMAWVLRGFLSTNTWENIDSLYDAYPERRDDLSVDDYKPSRDEVLDKVFEYFTEDAEEGERRKLWEEINQHIEENA